MKAILKSLHLNIDMHVDHAMSGEDAIKIIMDNVEKDNQSFAGSWLAYRYDGQLKLGMNFSDNDPFFQYVHE